MEVTDPTYFGTTTFGEPEPISECLPGDPTRKLTGTCAHGEWRPPQRIAKFLPKDCRVPLDCYTAADGLRRIVPRCNFEELIDLGAMCGRAIYHSIRGFDQDSDDYSRAMHLIHQYVCGRKYLGTRGMQEHLTRKFEYSRDLYVRRSGRHADSERDVLPEDLGLTAEAAGRRPSVLQLTKLGREAAREAHYRNPTSKSAIPFGLYETAKREPLEAEPEKILSLVESALFDVESLGEPPSDELVTQVISRLSKAVAAHESNTTDDFYKWFSGPNNSLVKQIAQPKNQPGGKLSREDVRRTLLHLGIEAFRFLGPCIHAMMRTIKNSIPQPLSEKEERLFEHMHESQPYYGNLPAALFARRTSEIERAVLAIWDEPENHEHVPVLHRLLYYYSEMAKRRRQADAQCKKRARPSQEPRQETDSCRTAERQLEKSGNPKSCSSLKTSSRCGCAKCYEEACSPAVREEDRFAVIGERLRELREIKCPAGCSHWEYHRDGESPEEVTVRLRCECGQIGGTITMPLDEFAENAERAIGRRRLPSTTLGNGGTAGDGDS